MKYNTEETYLQYKNNEGESEFTTIADNLEFGPPTDEHGNELELVGPELFFFCEKQSRFVELPAANA